MPSTPPKALRPSSPFQAHGEISPGKDIDLRCTTAGSTSPCLGHNSFAVDCPLAVLGSAFYPVPVRRPAASLPASFTPASRSDALRFASLAVTSSREDFHLLVNAHAGHTANGSARSAPWPTLRDHDLCGKFFVGHQLHPGRVTAVERFLYRHVGHASGWGAPVPVFLARWNPDHIARFDLAHRFALGLDPADARDDVQRLAERVCMPVGPRAGLEGHAICDNARRRFGCNDGIRPDGAVKMLFGRPACRPRAGEMDIHDVPPAMTDAVPRRADYFFEAA